MTETLQSAISIRDACRIFFRHRAKVCVFFVSVMLLVTLGTLLSKRIYRSQGKLLVRLGRENTTLDATTTLGESPVVSVPHTREHEINSVVEILRSRILVERVVDALSPAVILGNAPANRLQDAGQKETAAVAAHVPNTTPPVAGTESWFGKFNPFEPLTQRDRAILEFRRDGKKSQG